MAILADGNDIPLCQKIHVFEKGRENIALGGKADARVVGTLISVALPGIDGEQHLWKARASYRRGASAFPAADLEDLPAKRHGYGYIDS
jgi:hypothetical protein